MRLFEMRRQNFKMHVTGDQLRQSASYTRFWGRAWTPNSSDPDRHSDRSIRYFFSRGPDGLDGLLDVLALAKCLHAKAIRVVTYKGPN